MTHETNDEGPEHESPDPGVDEATRALQRALDARDIPQRFSEEALARMFDRQTAFLVNLGEEAVLVARRAGNHEVQPVDVSTAEAILGGGRTPTSHRVAEVGGSLVFGVAASQGLTESLADNPRPLVLILSGVFLLASAISTVVGLLAHRR